MLINFFFYNFLFILLLAIFEIAIEKQYGWGGNFNEKHWYARKVSVPIHILTGTKPLLLYHLVMLGIIYPVFLFNLSQVFAINNLLVIGGTFIISLAVEDFLWFLLNPYFHSLKELLRGPKGNIWWHVKWQKIGSVYIPGSYITSLALAAIFFVIAYVIM